MTEPGPWLASRRPESLSGALTSHISTAARPLCPPCLGQTLGQQQQAGRMDGLRPRPDAPVFPPALISVSLAPRTGRNGWRTTSVTNEHSAGSGWGHRLIISRPRIDSDFGVTVPRPAPLLFMNDPRCPGQPWRMVCPGEGRVRPREPQARNPGGKEGPHDQPVTQER